MPTKRRIPSRKDKILTEDDCKKLKEEVQNLTKSYEDTVNALAEAKEAEVMGS